MDAEATGEGMLGHELFPQSQNITCWVTDELPRERHLYTGETRWRPP